MKTIDNDLFSPYQIGNVTLKNKLVMAPMTRGRADNKTHIPTEIQGEYYEQRATAGLIITEGIVINPKAHGSINIPAIYNDSQVDSWKKITDRVHKANGKIFAQIWHVGRVSHPDLLDGDLPVAPSAINPNISVFTSSGHKDSVTPRELTIKEIIQIENEFEIAAINAIAAGFDGIEIHAANSYLIHQFMADSSNTRKDEYGGTTENKARFLFEIIDKISKSIGNDKVGVRLSPLWSNGGIVLDNSLKNQFEFIIDKLSDYNLAYLHLTGIGNPTPNTNNPAEDITKLAKKYRENFKGSIIINGSFDKASAQKALEENAADMVAFGMPFLSTPDLVFRMQNDLDVNSPDKTTLYEGGEKGYIDYPFYKTRQELS